MSEGKLLVAEEFYSIQGEGLWTGVPAIFLRLTGCNLTCPGWATATNPSGCDTTEVWKKGKFKTYQEIVDGWEETPGWIPSLLRGGHLVITGGEPLLGDQQRIVQFIHYLNTRLGYCVFVEIETNGTQLPIGPLRLVVSHFTVSPKLASSGNAKDLRFQSDVLKCFAGLKEAWFKFVVSSESDIEELENISIFCDIPHDKIFLMPMGSTKADLAITMPPVVEFCKKYGYRFSPREHVMIWDKAVGV